LPEKKKDSWLINQGKQEPGKNDGKIADYCAILRPHCFVIFFFLIKTHVNALQKVSSEILMKIFP
jgi:hypothetical protein